MESRYANDVWIRIQRSKIHESLAASPWKTSHITVGSTRNLVFYVFCQRFLSCGPTVSFESRPICQSRISGRFHMTDGRWFIVRSLSFGTTFHFNSVITSIMISMLSQGKVELTRLECFYLLDPLFVFVFSCFFTFIWSLISGSRGNSNSNMNPWFVPADRETNQRFLGFHWSLAGR